MHPNAAATTRSIAFLAIICALTTPAHAFPPTVSPNIHLSNALDDATNGYCIDITGWGPRLDCTRVQAHSCKARGMDTQFVYVDVGEPATGGRIKSVYSGVQPDGSCGLLEGQEPDATFSASACLEETGEGGKLTLAPCDGANAKQRFDFDGSTGTINAGGGTESCLTVGADSFPANIYLARDLTVAPCSSAQDEHKTWTVIGGVAMGDGDAGDDAAGDDPTGNEGDEPAEAVGDEATGAASSTPRCPNAQDPSKGDSDASAAQETAENSDSGAVAAGIGGALLVLTVAALLST